MSTNRGEKKTDYIQKGSPAPARILLVDDHAAFRSEFIDCFTEYDIIEACNGEEALDIMRRPDRIDLVILDIMMPGMDGIQVLGEIRKINPGVGIIIQTGYDAKELSLNALMGEADDYLEKPLNIDAARKAIGRLLSPDLI